MHVDAAGPFLRDYARSVRGVRGWGDGDPFIVNYVGHPFEGAVAGYIQIHNDPHYRQVEFGASSQYWASRLRAMAFSAVYSAQFEVGPVSEAPATASSASWPAAFSTPTAVSPT